MTPDERQLLQRIGHGLLFIDIFPNVAINLTFGIFASLPIMIIHSLISERKGTSTQIRITIGVAVVALLALATVTALETWNTIKLLTVFEKSSLSLIERITSLNLYSAKISVTYDWLTLVPAVFNDALIIWRAYTLAAGVSGRKWVLYPCAVVWVTCFGTTLTFLIFEIPHTDKITPMEISSATISILLAVTLFLSFSTNLVSVALVASILWDHRRFLQKLGKQKDLFTSWHVLLVLVESGAIYGMLQLINAILLMTSSGSDASTTARIALTSIYSTVSLLYPVLTIGIIRGPFSLVNVRDSVMEMQTIPDHHPLA